MAEDKRGNDRDDEPRGISLGIALWNQAATWAEFEAAARRIDALGYDHVFTWDHLYGIVGDPYQATFEGYSALAALAQVTQRVRLGLFVGAVTFRNPAVVAKALTTIDQISGGRAIAALGGAWFELEHEAAGIDFGRSIGERLDWLDEAAGALRTLFDGGVVTSEPEAHYDFNGLVLLPRPVQPHLPILIGGGGEKKTLRIVAKHADMWNGGGSAEQLAHKRDVLWRHCEEIGRDPSEIELTASFWPIIRSTDREAREVWEATVERNRIPWDETENDDAWWVGTPDLITERLRERVAVGFRTFIAELPAPYDDETLERLMTEVRPAVEA
jgi:alkanesulfonate monooxygenase SsuD/methylene tetrahydromethanopterin reductase-like flavin-dependent oxidoreductase (luciferase family)